MERRGARNIAPAIMNDMRLSSENVSIESFTRMLSDPALRPLLELDLTEETARTVLSSPQMTIDYYELWSSRTAASVPPAGHVPSAPTAHTAGSASPYQPRTRDVEPASLTAAIHAVVWPAVSLAVVMIFGMIGVAVGVNAGYENARVALGTGYFLAIACTVTGVIFGLLGLQEGLISPGARRRATAIAMGAIGIAGSLFLTVSWIYGWMIL